MSRQESHVMDKAGGTRPEAPSGREQRRDSAMDRGLRPPRAERLVCPRETHKQAHDEKTAPRPRTTEQAWLSPILGVDWCFQNCTPPPPAQGRNVAGNHPWPSRGPRGCGADWRGGAAPSTGSSRTSAPPPLPESMEASLPAAQTRPARGCGEPLAPSLLRWA